MLTQIKKEFNSKFTTNSSSVYISDNMSGKMSGVPAISTNNLLNPFCNARKNNPDYICNKCFADKTVNRYSALRDNLTANYLTLTGSVLPFDELPIFGNVSFVRLEAFGDLANVTQAINYINIAYKNPSVTFTIWTKNYNILDQAITAYGKPDNLICILSSIKLNQIDAAYKKYSWIDHVFTVYTPGYIADNNVDINCGARSCVSCRRCYDRSNKDFFISEQLK